jgi:hypothetical protein
MSAAGHATTKSQPVAFLVVIISEYILLLLKTSANTEGGKVKKNQPAQPTYIIVKKPAA